MKTAISIHFIFIICSDEFDYIIATKLMSKRLFSPFRELAIATYNQLMI